MKIKSHWSRKYLIDRMRLMFCEYRNPNNPWWTKDSIEIVKSVLNKSDSVLEFGSGRSTVWLGNRCANIVSIEHDLKWAEKVSRLQRASNINLKIVTPKISSNIWVEHEFESSIYLEFPLTEGKTFDVIVVDGLFRGHCAKLATEILRPHGIIIVDNVNWYLPSHTTSPTSVPHDGKPVSKEWEVFYDKTISWRRVLTSNGVTDTAIYFS